jgi:hypothetical protein
MNDAMAVAAPGSHLISRPKGERRFLPSGGNRWCAQPASPKARKPRASVSSAKSETAPSYPAPLGRMQNHAAAQQLAPRSVEDIANEQKLSRRPGSSSSTRTAAAPAYG